MRLAFLLVALSAIFQGTQAQSSATVLVEDSTYYGSYNGYMSTSFVGLKLPSGGGSVSITISPGDYASNVFASSFSDHTQDGPYYYQGPSTVFTISATGKYWVYLSTWGTTTNWDYLEIRVEASTYSGSVPCYYCAPPSGWEDGWPPLGSPQTVGTDVAVVPASQPGPPPSPYVRVPKWLIAVLAVVIGVSVLIPLSYLVYRRVQNKKKTTTQANNNETETNTPTESQVEMQPTTAVNMEVATAV